MLTRRAPGFTLIELLIGLVLLGVLMVLAAPSFTAMLQNMKLRGTAEALSAGLQAARGEALKRNAQVEFLLTDADPTAGSVAGAAVTNNGPNFMVRAKVGVGGYVFVEGRSGNEGQHQTEGSAVNVQVNGTPVAAPSPPGLTAGAVTFNSVGRALIASDAVFTVTNPAGGACKAAGGPMTCLNVVVTPGGRIRMCNPDPAIPNTDSRAC